MAITYPISLPPGGIDQITMTMVNTVAVSTSPFTGQQQVYRHAGDHWTAEVRLHKMERVDAEKWIAALGSLYGQYGKMLLGDPAGVLPQGTISGTLTVNGAEQTGTTLIVSATNGTLVAGDYIQLGSGATSRMHKVLVDVASGGTTLELFPRLRESPADGSIITYQNCKGMFRLATSSSPFQYVSPVVASIQFSAREAV